MDLPGGIAGQSAVRLDDTILLVGGQQKEDWAPAAPALAEVWVIEPRDAEPALHRFSLPSELATGFAAAAEYGGKMFLLGGFNANGISSTAYCLERGAASSGDGWVLKRLRDLPYPLAMAAAGALKIVVDEPGFVKKMFNRTEPRLYFLGGITDLASPSKASRSLMTHALPLEEMADPSFGPLELKPIVAGSPLHWAEQPGRAQPAQTGEDWVPVKWNGQTLDEVLPSARLGMGCVVQNGSLLFVGGWDWNEQRDLYEADTTGWRFKPGAVFDAGWRELMAAPEPLGLASAIPAGPQHVLVSGAAALREAPDLTGVVNASRSEGVWFYGVITDAWAPFEEETKHVGSSTGLRLGGNRADIQQIGEFYQIAPTGEVRSFRIVRAEVRKKSFSWAAYLVVGIYFAAMLGIGVFFSRRERSAEDFFVGGRRVPWMAVAMNALR